MSLLLNSFENSELGKWKELSAQMFTAIDNFSQSETAELDQCLDRLDEFLTNNCRTTQYPRLFCEVLETLPRFDQALLERKVLHPKLLSICCKNTLKLLSNNATTLPKPLNGACLLEACTIRVLKSELGANRTREEEAKIETFFCNQLAKLLSLQLPNRMRAYPSVALALIALKRNCKPAVCLAMENICKDKDLLHSNSSSDTGALLHEVCQVFARDADLLELFFTLALPELSSSSVLDGLGANCIDTVAKVMAKTRGVITLEQVLQQDNVLDFLLHARACEYKQQSECWSKVALQGMQYRAETELPLREALKIELFARFAWRMHAHAMLETLARHSGSSNLDAATPEGRGRILLLKSMPNECITASARQYVLGLTVPDASLVSVRWQLECLVVRGRFGFYSREAITIAMRHLRSEFTLCLDVFCANAACFTDATSSNSIGGDVELLIAMLESVASHHEQDSAAASARLLSSLASKTALLFEQPVAPQSLTRIAQLCVRIFRQQAMQGSAALKRDAFYHFAELLALVSPDATARMFAHELAQDAELKRDFLAFLSQNRALPPVEDACFTRMTFPKISAQPRQRMVVPVAAAPPTTREEEEEDCLARVKRICQQSKDLAAFESRLVQILQQARTSLS